MNRTIVPVAILSAAIFFTASNAQAQSTHVSEPVSYADLNLRTPSGQAALDGRIRAAARRICQVSGQNSDLGEWVRQRRCFRESMYLARGRARVAIAQAQADGVSLASR
ncbi:UrcA family protein [Sphingosinicella sp. YJ22]|uniref:UrcA family protein n=1 Tax=Sphingosinicella sp. YJ22 TaxID=1104780 RepID=UPI00140A2E2B|nr:UrcA family protein [Sphingosinicella sp. YJ22]